MTFNWWQMILFIFVSWILGIVVFYFLAVLIEAIKKNQHEKFWKSMRKLNKIVEEREMRKILVVLFVFGLFGCAHSLNLKKIVKQTQEEVKQEVIKQVEETKAAVKKEIETHQAVVVISTTGIKASIEKKPEPVVVPVGDKLTPTEITKPIVQETPKTEIKPIVAVTKPIVKTTTERIIPKRHDKPSISPVTVVVQQKVDEPKSWIKEIIMGIVTLILGIVGIIWNNTRKK